MDAVAEVLDQRYEHVGLAKIKEMIVQNDTQLMYEEYIARGIDDLANALRLDKEE